MPLRRAGKGSGLGAHATDPFTSWGKTRPVAGTAEPIARALASQAWRRLSAGDGTKGPRLDDGASVELADLEAEEDSPEPTGLWTRGLLIRRTITDQDLAFFSPWCPAGTLMETLVRVQGDRGCVRDRPDGARAHPQRNPLLAWLASAWVSGDAGLRHDGRGAPARPSPDLTPKKNRRGQAAALVCWSVQDIRRVATRLAQRRIEPAFVIAWSAWRRAHQAVAQASHRKPHIASESCNCSAKGFSTRAGATSWPEVAWFV